MTVAFPGLPVPDPVTVDINIRVSGQIAVGSLAARQKVNRFVVSQIGNLLCAGSPALVVDERFYWRVPVLATMPGQGELGQVGEINVDAQTGEIDADEMTITRIQQNARSLAADSPLSPKQ
jgi:hypothetical protein